MFLPHWELQHYYPLWKWAMSVFGINWFRFVVDIFHLLSWERAEWVCSSRVLKVEEKILIWGGSRSLRVQRLMVVWRPCFKKMWHGDCVFLFQLWFGKPKWAKMFLFQVPGLVTWWPQSIGVGTTSPGWSGVCCNSAGGWHSHVLPALGSVCPLKWGHKGKGRWGRFRKSSPGNVIWSRKFVLRPPFPSICCSLFMTPSRLVPGAPLIASSLCNGPLFAQSWLCQNLPLCCSTWSPPQS